LGVGISSARLLKSSPAYCTKSNRPQFEQSE
jgi:hypothetical protein